ncbi:MAG: cyclohexanecarboxylate-CoA ligase [Fimbriimonadaceae bacterium]|nr:cyclohexanecarboxylate-CoA ligase [Alphaproteobacteria bacterium]
MLTDYLDDAVARHPDKAAIVDHNSMNDEATTLSFRQLQRIVGRIAAGLAKMGVEKGTIVACQLPNWWQFVALYLACARLGAIINPLMPIFRQRELRYMLGFSEAKVLVIPRLFRGCDYPAMIADIRADLPHLTHVLVIGGNDDDSFERRLVEHRWEDEVDLAALFARHAPSPNDVTQLLYTSGTTGEPKGVMHTSNTLLSILSKYQERLGLSGNDVIFMASPMGHQAGFMYGLMMGPMLGAKLVLQDIWNADQAALLIQDEAVSYTMGSTPFLADLTDSPAVDHTDMSSLRTFVSSGAPIPSTLVQRATRHLGARIISAWGMSENGSVTTTVPGDPDDRIFGTDGIALPGIEVRVVDSDGSKARTGVEGHLQCRGISMFVGYFRRPDLNRATPDGWFDTGDLARMDADGYIRITGRAKDIVIRGGENIPVVEIENLLYRHPAIRQVSIVAVPDPRLGERACAFVVLREGKHFDFAEMVAYLEQHQLARQYLPEFLEVLPQMPMTASGKIQKFQLREMAKYLDRK